MTYEFSLGSFFVGLLIIAAGAAFAKWHQQVADNLGGGVGSYEQYKLWAFITCGLGVVVMLNLHAAILGWLFGMLFHR